MSLSAVANQVGFRGGHPVKHFVAVHQRAIVSGHDGWHGRDRVQDDVFAERNRAVRVDGDFVG